MIILIHPVVTGLFDFFNNGFECFRMIHGQVCQYFTVKFDTSCIEFTHEYGIRYTILTATCIDTLNPQCAEVAFFVFTTCVSVIKSSFYSVLRYGPNIFTTAIVTFGHLKDLLASCT